MESVLDMKVPRLPTSVTTGVFAATMVCKLGSLAASILTARHREGAQLRVLELRG
jgi:hypothetical protein